MSAMDFPSSPTNNQQTSDGRYYFDSSVGTAGGWRSTPLPVGGLPAGSIIQWSGSTAPANWLICDGSAVSRSVYPSLFAVVGTTYGAGDGSTTFNLPDLRGRIPVGKNGGSFGTLGATGGAETVTLTTAQMPSHSHTQNAHSHTGYTSTNGNHDHNIYSEYGASGEGYFNPYNNRQIQPAQPGAGTRIERGGMLAGNGNHSHSIQTYDSTAINQNTGGGEAHSNLQPYLVTNYIIKTSVGWTAGDSELATRMVAAETTNTAQNTRLTALETTVDTAWVTYTPTFYNATIGNGTVAFYYKKIGKIVHIRGRFTLGTTSNIGSLLDWSLPIIPSSRYGGLISMGQASYYNGAIFYGTNVGIGGTTMRSIRYVRDGADNIRNNEIVPTTPFTWGSGCFFETELFLLLHSC